MGHCRGRRLAATLSVLLAAGPAAAEEWHEAYRAGMTALARGEPQRAADALRRAIALRPEPGRNVVTYGTNFEPRYYPYLGLAQACLALGQYAAAREALETSARWGREPAQERLALQVRLESAMRPPPPATTGAAPTVPSAPVPGASSAATSPPAATPSPAPSVAPATLAALPGSAPRAASPGPPRERPRILPSPTLVAPPSATVPAGTAPVVTPPPGVPSARPVSPVADGRGLGWIGFGLVGLGLVAAVSWLILRGPGDARPLWTATPPARASHAAADVPTPRGQANPGARRDAEGREWFGEFRLLEMLGRGGMASVFAAERGGERVALKRPLAFLLDDPGFLARFLREAEIGRTLNHPNIVRILGRGDVEGVPYFTMELLAGETLQAVIRQAARPDPRAAAAIVVQAAEALDFAHGKGVVHRDLKPSNIMLLPDGRVKVMDFGIARAQRLEGLTATGAFLGTPDYLAPEVIEGGRAEPRSDLYSLGVVFYELLTGQRPFSGETAFAVLRKHVAEPATPPSLVRRGIPAELDTLVGRLLAKSPDARPESAEETVVALRDWLNRRA